MQDSRRRLQYDYRKGKWLPVTWHGYGRIVLPIIVLLTSLASLAGAQSSSTVVISQIYGGGGTSGATLRNDFIELFNRGNSPVNIGGWSVQYASAAGSTWDRTALSGTIGPGQYYLIQEQQGSGGSVSLPAADATGGINLSATSGKVALVANSNNLTTSAPAGSAIIDSVGYGSANSSKGQPAAALTNTTAAIRRSGGCMDTNNNQADFSIGSPNPHNSRSPVNFCSGSPPPPAPLPPQITTLKNAASLAAGAVAPGEIVTISGSNFGPRRGFQCNWRVMDNMPRPCWPLCAFFLMECPLPSCTPHRARSAQ